MKKLAFILFLIVFSQCSIDRSITSLSQGKMESLSVFQHIEPAHQLKICGAEEPGEKLLLCLTFVDKISKAPLANQEVYFYHTTSSGKYELSDPNDESSARLNGKATSDAMGRIYLETIFPGAYGESEDNNHIHTTVKGAHPEFYDIHFNQYSGYMFRNFVKGSDQHFLTDLKKQQDATLISFLTIEVKL